MPAAARLKNGIYQKREIWERSPATQCDNSLMPAEATGGRCVAYVAYTAEHRRSINGWMLLPATGSLISCATIRRSLDRPCVQSRAYSCWACEAGLKGRCRHSIPASQSAVLNTAFPSNGRQAGWVRIWLSRCFSVLWAPVRSVAR
jgi:hypothetical protein